jgi:hypothetical protein
MKKKKYWVQTLYAVIAPDGSAEDYLFDKKSAKKLAKELNFPPTKEE